MIFQYTYFLGDKPKMHIQMYNIKVFGWLEKHTRRNVYSYDTFWN